MPNEKDTKASNGTGSNQAAHSLDRYTIQPQGDKKDDSPFYKSAAPSISLPKGGGALKGIDEKFSVNAVNGTAGLEIPLPLTPGRGGFTPSLSLSYNSGSGNSEFGLGWNLGLPAIQRRTDKQLPLYNDAGESDVFLLAGAEDMVPVIDEDPNPFTSGDYTIKRYRPRIEGLFARIEYIKKAGVTDSWWRVTTKDNIITYYGLSAAGRIADPENDYRIFKWLPELTIDNKGNVQQFEYIAENTLNVVAQVNERNRLNETAPIANTYLKRVLYCNKVPYFIASGLYEPTLPSSVNYLMETVLDYGDHCNTDFTPQAIPTPTPPTSPGWPSRSDAFSDFHAGFEIRTYRRCKRVLMFHHFTELSGNEFIRALELAYENDGSTDVFTEADFITTATQRGYDYKSGGWQNKALPSMTFHYRPHQPLDWDTSIHAVSKEDFKNAPQGLTGPYQWMDFEGEGISGIFTEQANGWFYKNNLGDGQFDTAKAITLKPSYAGLGSGALQWQDLQADGRRQVVAQAPTKGYWELDDDQQWQPFRTFAKNLNIDWNSPFTKMLDLNGDGRADVLITEDRAWTWYENMGTDGYDIGGNSRIYTDEEKGPMLLLRDTVQSIFLADMSGDGMTDLVRIKNSEICYWPNMGYGKFGAKVTMVNTPIFQTPDLYNPLYLTLADISGTGAADLIYVGKNKCTVWINLAGNAWGEAVDINPLPGTDAMSKISVLDFLGNGTGCIVWSSPLPNAATAPLQYIDLMHGVKPYLMLSYDSGMGKTVTVTYKSSTQYYLADKKAGNPWITRLPFPVQCIDTVTTADSVSQTTYSQSYRYRHGYYDHEEREFRGFGYVETTDIDSAIINEADPPVDDTTQRLDQVPVLTKTWNHTGAWLREQTLLDQYQKEYFQFTDWDGVTVIATLPDPTTLNAQEWREAHRALKGHPLRQEVYALDGTNIPYSVTATAYTVTTVQRQGSNRYASFLSYQQQSIAIGCERNATDPRMAQQLTLAIDTFGNVLQSASVVYPRKITDTSAPTKVQDEQGINGMHISYSESNFTTDAIDDYQYRLRLSCEALSYEILGYTVPTGLWTIDGLNTLIAGATEIDFSATPTTGVVEKRKLSHSTVLYKSNSAIATPLAFGQLQSLAIPHQQYHLAYTAAVLANCYNTLVTATMMTEGGYVSFNGDSNYWLPSGTAIYTNPTTKFYAPETFTDPWGSATTVNFGTNGYYLLPSSVIDAVGNTSRVSAYDWRILQPLTMVDPNNNISDILYDALGMPVAMALSGKGTGTEGDSIAGLDIYNSTDIAAQAAFFTDPEAHAAALLKDATWRCVYDLNYATTQRPVSVGMIARQQHVHNPVIVTGQGTDCILRLSYSDGMGRVLMHKAQCQDTLENGGLKWVGSGRTIYNNKGSAVMQYEPYFSTTHLCDLAEQAANQGVSPKIYYDPLNRVQRTELPDGSFTKTEWTAWDQKIYDNNDTVEDSQWYTDRISGGLGIGEQDAAEKAAVHYNTPTLIYTDTLARAFYTVTDPNNGTGVIDSYVNLDLLGNRISVIDGLGRQPLTYVYNMLKQVTFQHSIDSGDGYTMVDVAGQPLYAWDANGRQFHMQYDVLRRVTKKFCDSKPLELMQYGETVSSPETLNLRGQLFAHFDGSGRLQMLAGYDFKGNPLGTSQQLLADRTITDVDWDASPALDTEVWTSSIAVDALNRPVRMIDARSNKTEHVYDLGGALKTVRLNGTTHVSDIHYDAKGQRQAIWYGNNTKTGYTYDPDTFRLKRLLTINLNTLDNPDDATVQDLRYHYDPVGNITRVRDHAQQTLFYANTIIDPTQDFTYDAIYRLIQAKGREQINNGDFSIEDNWYDNGYTVPLGSDAAQNYTQKYVYDNVGNILSLQHIAGSGSYTRTYDYVSDCNRLNGTTEDTAEVPPDYSYPYSYSYDGDARGNMTTMPHLSNLSWNEQNELGQITRGDNTTNYQYGGGQRIRKYTVKDTGTNEERIYFGSLEIYRRLDSSNVITFERVTVHISDDTGRIAMNETYDADIYSDSTPSELTRYIYSNHLQSASIELDEGAGIISYEEYHPYGTTAYQMTNHDVQAAAKRYRFTGKEKDEESGLYYHGARYYIPWLGRWTASDPLESKFGGMSPYNYCENNPIMYNDLSGMAPGDGDKVVSTSAKPQTVSTVDATAVAPIVPVMLDEVTINGYKDRGPGEYHFTMTMNAQGTADLKLESFKNKNDHSFLGIHWSTKIDVKRYIVDFNFLDEGNKRYYIGFPQEGKGYSNAWKSEQFENDYLKNNGNPIAFNFNYATENGSNAASTAYYGINAQNRMMEGAIPMGESITVNAQEIRFSQSTVNGLEEIESSMKANGWRGEPIDIVKMEDDIYTTVDNTRILAAQNSNTKVQAIVHNFNDPISPEQGVRFADKKGLIPNTWGQAILNRISNQSASFRSQGTNGSFAQPRAKN
jgi:RHS repeat-associated protein